MARSLTACILTIAISVAAAEKPCPQPLWTTDLTLRHHFRPFGIAKHPRNQLAPHWKDQQGVVFIKPGKVAVFQVIEGSQPPPLRSKDLSGGGGRYTLQVSVIDATTGEDLKTLRLVTTGSGSSQVLPTHDGRFLVRTGEVMRLFAANFEELVAAHFPHSKAATFEWSDIHLSSSRRIIHVIYHAGYSTGLVNGEALLDADTLDPVPESRAGELTLREPRPSFRFIGKDYSCVSALVPVAADRFAGYGCKELKLFTSDGRLLWSIPMHQQVVSVQGGGTIMAAAIKRYRLNPLDLDYGPEPLRIELYDLATMTEKCLIPRSTTPEPDVWPSMLYALSSTGDVAVIQGRVLSVYKP